MEYLKCVRCGLEMRPRPARVQIENCPRCLARSATMAPMARVPEALGPAVGWGGRTMQTPAGADRDTPAAKRRAGASRRASQGVLASAVREMRSQGRARPAR